MKNDGHLNDVESNVKIVYNNGKDRVRQLESVHIIVSDFLLSST